MQMTSLRKRSLPVSDAVTRTTVVMVSNMPHINNFLIWIQMLRRKTWFQKADNPSEVSQPWRLHKWRKHSEFITIEALLDITLHEWTYSPINCVTASENVSFRVENGLLVAFYEIKTKSCWVVIERIEEYQLRWPKVVCLDLITYVF